MKSQRLVLLAAMAAGLSGCVTAPPRGSIVSVSLVLNQVKDELNAFAQTPAAATPNTGVCYDGKSPMNLIPLSVKTTLQTVSTFKNEAGIGVAAPLGVLSVDPSASTSYSRARTQTIVVPLNVPDPNSNQPVGKGDHPLAAAMSNFRDEILRVDHAKKPCLQFVKGADSAFTLSLAFDVVEDGAGGFGLQLAIFKISDKFMATEEAHQTLEVQLGLVPVDQTLLFQKQPAAALLLDSFPHMLPLPAPTP